MNIVAFIDISGGSGGGLQQTLGVVNILNKFKSKNFNIEFCCSTKNAINYLNSLGIQSKYFNKSNFINKLTLKLFKIKFIKRIFEKFKIINPFERFLKKNNYDLVFFVDQSNLSLHCDYTNFVFNIWNLDHRKHNFFPEYKYSSSAQSEKLYTHASNRAFRILTDCKKTKGEFSHFYKCPPKRIYTLPLIPNLIFKKVDENFKITNDKLLNIDIGKTLFFPAQFWAHKNHKYILDGLNFLQKKGIKKFNCIFTGRDRGNLNFIKKKILEYNLNENIHIFEYLKDEEIIYLYKNCFSVILPTYVGNSSLPLFEAFYFNCKIIYHAEILDDEFKDKVIQVNVKDPSDLGRIINRIEQDQEYFIKLVKKSKIYIDEKLNEIKLLEIFENIFSDYYNYHSRYK